MENKSWEQARKKKEDFLKKVIHPIFPKARYSSALMFGSPENAPNSFKGKLSSKTLFEETNYLYQGNGKFIHYTSLLGLKAILESGFLRMSEYGNLIDKQELIYAAKIFSDNPIFELNKSKLERLKDNLFCLSACKSNNQTKRNSFMWDNYGDKGKGVIIEFEFTKKDPYSFLFGNVQYGVKALNPLKKIKKLAEQFSKDNDGFFPNNFIELLLEIQSFHKPKKFKIEDEVRIFIKKEKQQYEEHKHATIYKDLNSNQEVRYFNKLFLKNRHEILNENKNREKDVFDFYPQIEIKNIILGNNLPTKKFKIYEFLNELKNKYKYEYNISYLDDELEIHPMRYL